jgi:medium-chain acyl-[acyl-carrier-protein] hydrolase
MNWSAPADRGWISGTGQPGTCTARVFCFHCAGASAGQFREWIGWQPPKIEFAAIQLPGRELRRDETPYRRIGSLVEPLTAALTQHLDRPFAFFGHSMGALIAFEVARQLRRLGQPTPVHLFVAARPAPHLPNPYPAVDEMPDDKLLDVLRLYGGVSEETLLSRETMSWLLPTIRADFEMTRTYRYEYEPPLECPITAMHGTSDATCTESHILAWADQTEAAFQRVAFPGGHFFVRSRFREIVASISRALPE